jgi:hypothetical protein
MEAAVQFMVPVTVFVDTETKEVVRVLQENENMFLPDTPDVWDESWIVIQDEALVEEAIDIAKDNDWPAWDVA